MSIRGLQRATAGASLGTEFRHRGTGAPLAVDYAANARSMGCDAVEVDDVDALAGALDAARDSRRTTVIVCPVEPQRGLLPSGAFWDLGVAEVSAQPEVRDALAQAEAGRAQQRHHAWRDA